MVGRELLYVATNNLLLRHTRCTSLQGRYQNLNLDFLTNIIEYQATREFIKNFINSHCFNEHLFFENFGGEFFQEKPSCRNNAVYAEIMHSGNVVTVLKKRVKHSANP